MLNWSKKVVSMTLSATFVLVVGELTTASAADKWGNLKGKFIYDGKADAPVKLNITKDPQICDKTPLYDESLVVSDDGGLANVFVYVRSKKVDAHPDYVKTANDTIRIDNHKCRFEPHASTIRIGQLLDLHNSDAEISHNSNLSPIGDVAVNPNIPAGQSAAEYKFGKSQNLPVPVVCNIHPWMKGWVLPRDNPYAVVTAADGAFEIKNLPVGKLEFQVWQEKAGYLEAKSEWKKGRFELTIKEGDNDLGVIKVDPKLFKK